MHDIDDYGIVLAPPFTLFVKILSYIFGFLTLIFFRLFIYSFFFSKSSDEARIEELEKKLEKAIEMAVSEKSEDKKWLVKFKQSSNGEDLLSRIYEIDNEKIGHISAQFPYFLRITILNVNESTLPIENRIEALFCEENRGKLVATFDYGSKKKFCIYVGNGQVEDRIKKIAREFPHYFPTLKSQYACRLDAQWDIYKNIENEME